MLLTLLAPQGAAGSVSGTIAATAPAATADFTGTHTAPNVSGTIAATAPVATAAISGARGVAGSVSADAPAATLAASGAHGVAGTLTASTPVATLSASGARGAAGTIGADAPIAVATIAGAVGGAAVVGTLTAAAPIAVADFAGFTPPASLPAKGAAGDNARRRRRGTPARTYTLAEWQEEQRRKRLPPQAGELAEIVPATGPAALPVPHGLSMPTGALAGLIPPRPLPASLIPRPVPAAWQDDDEDDLELLLLA